jgi:hypothetical protein
MLTNIPPGPAICERKGYRAGGVGCCIRPEKETKKTRAPNKSKTRYAKISRDKGNGIHYVLEIRKISEKKVVSCDPKDVAQSLMSC